MTGNLQMMYFHRTNEIGELFSTTWILLMLALLISGCSANDSVDCCGNGLVEDLYAKGATPSSTDELDFVGSEDDVGSDIRVAITDRKVIDDVWRLIQNSKPNTQPSVYAPRAIEFYSLQDLRTPLATLEVFRGDGSHVRGLRRSYWDNSKGAVALPFKCQGLNKFVMKYLRERYEERSKYLGEMPSVIADFEANSEDAELGFECFYHKSRRIQKGKITHHLYPEVVNIAIEQMPKPTVDFTRYLIQERFLSKPETWPDGFSGDRKDIEAVLRFVPVKDYYGEQFPEIWNYTLYTYPREFGRRRNPCIERFLISQNGYILYGGKRDTWNFSYVKRSKNGIFIDIIHSYFYPQDISADVTGIVTEYFYKFGDKELVKLNESNERVEVLHYLNNYFDGRFCNGKELPSKS